MVIQLAMVVVAVVEGAFTSKKVCVCMYVYIGVIIIIIPLGDGWRAERSMAGRVTGRERRPHTVY